MTRIKYNKSNNTRIGSKYVHNIPRVLHVITVLVNLRQTLATGKKNAVDRDYIFSRAGLYDEDIEMFKDILDWLTLAEFYRRTPDGLYYVL